MEIKKTMTVALSAMLFMGSGCGKTSETQIDTEYPVIDVTNTTAFPKQCSSMRRGEKIVFRARLSDNRELGSVSIDIHHNFDHHTHSTEVESCSMDPIKTPVKPMLLLQSFPITPGNKTVETQEEIQIPADIDAGDYHFLIRLTDKEGWQTIKGLSIKIN